jgi:hypothetical protein
MIACDLCKYLHSQLTMLISWILSEVNQPLRQLSIKLILLCGMFECDFAVDVVKVRGGSMRNLLSHGYTYVSSKAFYLTLRGSTLPIILMP